MAGSRLTKFTKIDPTYWDIINKTNKGSSCNILNIERDYPEKIKRTFCKCGYASGKEESICPICGNKNTMRLSIDGRNEIGIETLEMLRKETKYSPKKLMDEEVLNGYINEIFVKADTTDEFVFYETGEINVFSLGENTAINNLSAKKIRGYYNADLDIKNVVKNYPYDTTGFSKYYDQQLDGLIDFINLKAELPLIINNLNKYPNTANYILKNYSTGTKSLIYCSLIKWDEVYKLLKVPKKELYPYVEYMIELPHSYSWYSSSKNFEDTFIEYDLLSKEKQEIIDYIIIHGNLKAQTIMTMIEQLKKIPDSETEVVMNFVRTNYVSFCQNVFNEYKNKSDFFKNLGIEINITNMDTRNFNIYKNKFHMTTNQKYNEKRVNYFLDMFDLNPLESLKYLDSRRAPNKDLRAELSKKLD